MRFIGSIAISFLLLTAASAQQPPQQRITPAEIAINIEDSVHALAKFADQQAHIAETLNEQVKALTKERDDLKKKLEAASNPASADKP